MRPPVRLSWPDLWTLVGDLRAQLQARGAHFESLYGVPTGGAIVALMLCQHTGWPLVEEPGPATLVVDDICDSGRTLLSRRALGELNPTAVLHVRPTSRHVPTYYVEATEAAIQYPYEHRPLGEEVVTRMIELVGDDPRRPGLQATPARVVRAWAELFSGYRAAPTLTTFEADDPYDEIIISRDIGFVSTCEHHWLPFYGRAHVGYLPGSRILGLSKMARVVDKYARRLQLQERMTQQIAQELMATLTPLGVGVVVEGTHFCQLSRGVRQPESVMVTSAMLGRFRDSAPARAEFLSLLGRR